MHLKLAQVDQTFTAKYVGRGVIDTCTRSTGSTGSISGTDTGNRYRYRCRYIGTYIGYRCYIGITHVEFRECFFVSQHSSNVNLTQITNGWINGLQQIIGTQRVENMRPLDRKTLVDQLPFQEEKGLIMIVNSRGLISVTHVLRVLIHVIRLDWSLV